MAKNIDTLINMIKEGCENEYVNLKIHKNLNFHWIIRIENGVKFYEIHVFL